MGLRIKNKKATFNYELIVKYVAGIQLTGTEIKSIRSGNVAFTDAYCYFVNGELWLKNLHIALYTHASHFNHQEKRERKLLLNKKELLKIERRKKESALAIIPVSLFINENGWAKIEIALARGKRKYDKRETLKRKDAQREMDKKFKYRR